MKAVTPTLTPALGRVRQLAERVDATTTTSGATICATPPTAPSRPRPRRSYSAAFTVADTQTVKARAYKTGWTSSDSGYASYWIGEGTVATPTITPTGGTQTSPPLVAITTATSARRFATRLTDRRPPERLPVFVYPFLVPVTTTVKAKAFKAGIYREFGRDDDV